MRTSTRFIGCICFAVILALGVATVVADVPQFINYQGKLLDNGGCVDGTAVDLTLTFWNDNTSTAPGDKLFQESHTGVTVTKGLFNVLIGNGATQAGSLNDVVAASEAYLGVKIDGGDALTPRTRIVSIPYALNSDKLGGQSASYYLNASNINAGTLADDRLSADVTKLGSTIDSAEVSFNYAGSSSKGGPATTAEDLTITGQTLGDLLYFDGSNGSNWVRLPAGTAGQFLKTQGTVADPVWDTVDTGGGDSTGGDAGYLVTAVSLTNSTLCELCFEDLDSMSITETFPAGDLSIEFDCEWSTSNSKVLAIRVLIDGVQKARAFSHQGAFGPSATTGTGRYFRFALTEESVTAGSHTINIQFAAYGSGNTVYVTRRTLEAGTDTFWWDNN